MKCAVVAAAVVISLVSREGLGDIVERRGSEPALQGDIVLIDDAGVTVRSALGAAHVVPWDRVRRVVGDVEDPALEHRVALATNLWRARSRVERHDTTLAEPLFERLFERYRGQTHETALVVAEGLLRCRLDRADHVLALIPALEVGRLRRANVTTDSYSALPAVIDSPTSLCMVLTPQFLPTPLLTSLAHDLSQYDAQGDEVIGVLAELYRRAVLQTLGETPPEPQPESFPDHPGVELLRFLVDCGAGDNNARRVARERLTRMIPSLPSWAEAWARFHIGKAMLRDSGLGRRHRGMVSLIHLPARFGGSQPYLAGLALAYIAQALEQAGDTEAAATLRTQLQRSFPNHPVHAVGVRPIGTSQPPITSPDPEEQQ